MYFSSDTNIWIDLQMLGAEDIPFQSEHVFGMYDQAINDEILSPPNLGERLLELGLKSIDICVEEFYLAAAYQGKYKALSTYDAIALAVAKHRDWILLTGDGPLRKAAGKEQVDFKGTLGLLDLLFSAELISVEKYQELLLIARGNPRIRWPEGEIDSRLDQLAGR